MSTTYHKRDDRDAEITRSELVEVNKTRKRIKALRQSITDANLAILEIMRNCSHEIYEENENSSTLPYHSRKCLACGKEFSP